MSVRVFFTIDTEEDLWGANKARFDNPVKNIDAIPALQDIFDRFNAIPTYLINYPVVTNKRAVGILDSIFSAGKCDIGTHCHPWNTPPYEEELTPANTMLSNLNEDLVFSKIKKVHDAIVENFNYTPVTFRAGRWGFNSVLAKCLIQLGYKVDTSVTATIDWQKIHGPDYTFAKCIPHYWDQGIDNKYSQELIEVPVTIGYLQKDFEKCEKVVKLVKRYVPPELRVLGILERLRFLNKRWLSPEVCTGAEMIKLAQNWVDRGAMCLTVPFHSNCLMPGITPFVKSKQELEAFLGKITEFLSYCQKQKWPVLPIKTAVELPLKRYDKNICFN